MKKVKHLLFFVFAFFFAFLMQNVNTEAAIIKNGYIRYDELNYDSYEEMVREVGILNAQCLRMGYGFRCDNIHYKDNSFKDGPITAEDDIAYNNKFAEDSNIATCKALSIGDPHGQFMNTYYPTHMNGSPTAYKNGIVTVLAKTPSLPNDYKASHEKIFEEKADELLEALNLNGKSDYEKAYIIYRWISNNVKYSENVEYSNQSAYSALIEKKCVCAGYAQLLYYLYNKVGINTYFDCGNNHAWNIVEMDGKYYYCDPTYDKQNSVDMLHNKEPYPDFLIGINSKSMTGVAGDNGGYTTNTGKYLYGASDDNLGQKLGIAEEDYEGNTNNVKIACETHTYEKVNTVAANCYHPKRDYYLCSVCGSDYYYEDEKTSSKLDHVYVPELLVPSCTEQILYKNVCTKCNKCWADLIDSQGHTEVEDPAVEATCQKEGKTRGVHCSVCGEIIVAQTTTLKAGHAWDDGTITTEATCQNEGVKTYSCATCNETKTEILKKTGHTMVTDTGKEPTCKEDGYTEKTYCSVCGLVEKESGKEGALGHDWDDGTVTKEPTCKEEGIKTYRCSRCTETKTGKLDKADHTWDNGRITKEATCKEEGIKTYTCTACQNTKTETVGKAGHKMVTDNRKEATCKEDGYTEKTYCSVCGLVEKESKKITALGHDWDDGTVTTEPTCKEEGIKTYRCSRCTETKTEKLDKTDHTWDEGKVTKESTCEEEGVKTFTCSVCKETKTEPVALGEHVMDVIPGKEATCEEDGLSDGEYCINCMEVFKEQEVIPALAHKNKKYEDRIEATCTEKGQTGDVYCKDCGIFLQENEEMPALGHAWDNGVITKKATYKEEGIKTYTCTRCNEKRTEKIPKVKVAKINIHALSAKIAAGKKVRLTALVTPINAYQKVRWTSSNKKVATVSTNGIVTFKKKTGGKNVFITATAMDGSGKKVVYRLYSMKGIVKKISVTVPKTTKAGTTINLKTKVTATSGANKKLVWKSSNERYAKVVNGKVILAKTAKGKSVKITAMATDGSGVKKTVTIKIR